MGDRAIAAALNRCGYRTGTGKGWREHRVRAVRHSHRLPNFEKGKEWVSIADAAKEFGVSDPVVRRLIRQGVLPAEEVGDGIAWLIKRVDLTLPAVEEQILGVKKGRRVRVVPRNQAELALKHADISEV